MKTLLPSLNSSKHFNGPSTSHERVWPPVSEIKNNPVKYSPHSNPATLKRNSSEPLDINGVQRVFGESDLTASILEKQELHTVVRNAGCVRSRNS